MTRQSDTRRKTVPGTILSVRNLTDRSNSLILVVDPVPGKKWLDRDPCLAFDPFKDPDPECTEKYILGRHLGCHLSERAFLDKSGLPEEEPLQASVVRWIWVQESQAYVLAGPDPQSIRDLIANIRECRSFGMGNPDFLTDLELVAEHLEGKIRPKSQMSIYAKPYFAMLADVLPRPAAQAAA